MGRLPFAGFSLSAAAQLYARRFEERSRNLALDFAQSRALLVLAENEGVTQRRLAELTAIASPSPCRSPGAISGDHAGARVCDLLNDAVNHLGRSGYRGHRAQVLTVARTGRVVQTAGGQRQRRERQ